MGKIRQSLVGVFCAMLVVVLKVHSLLVAGGFVLLAQTIVNTHFDDGSQPHLGERQHLHQHPLPPGTVEAFCFPRALPKEIGGGLGVQVLDELPV